MVGSHYSENNLYSLCIRTDHITNYEYIRTYPRLSSVVRRCQNKQSAAFVTGHQTTILFEQCESLCSSIVRDRT